MASLSRRVLWSFFHLVRQSSPIFYRRRVLSIFKGSWRQVLSVGFGASLCAIPVGQRSTPALSNESLIKRAASLVADSTQTLLSQTTYVLIDSLTEYTTAVYTLISLQKKFTSLLDKMNSSEESAIWQVIIGARVQMKKLEEEYLKYEASWARAVSLSEMAAEAAYHAGADQVAITVRNHIQLVQIQIQETRELVLKAEALLAASQSEEILKTITEDKNNPPDGGTPVIDSPEEVPEAYMRED
ncbi:diablo IAP-binding mitochondrial protein isoform X1 [Hyla sarda]|uniref:diablo IAP-binding mitochondrial protein isoform X1 n=1 Tax=Hyla sarda TaxID=327740 RepID=UPI0024C28955|nr:diablo IAP-binding mitochondrial protein isoform X1 [Hyla sarda]